MTPEEFRQALAARGVELSDHQMQQFADYYEYLVAVNEHVNLTAITQKDEVYLKHFYDSLIPALTVKDLQTESLTLCDVGAGAGFPSIPMKIAFPNLKVTIVDSLNKRIRFLNDLSERLGLEEVEFHRIFLIFNHLMKIKKTLFEQSHPVFDLPSRKLITSSAVKPK